MCVVAVEHFLIDTGPPGPNASPPVSSPAPSGDPANQPQNSAGGNKPGGMKEYNYVYKNVLHKAGLNFRV